MYNFFEYLAFLSGILTVILILVQTRGAGLGAGMGGGGTEGGTVRRGADKLMHQITIVAVAVFGSSLIAGFLI